MITLFCVCRISAALVTDKPGKVAYALDYKTRHALPELMTWWRHRAARVLDDTPRRTRDASSVATRRSVAATPPDAGPAPQTTRAATDLGFQCLLAHDACATRALAFSGKTIPAEQVHTAFLAALNGLFARVLSVDEACALP